MKKRKVKHIKYSIYQFDRLTETNDSNLKNTQKSIYNYTITCCVIWWKEKNQIEHPTQLIYRENTGQRKTERIKNFKSRFEMPFCQKTVQFIAFVWMWKEWGAFAKKMTPIECVFGKTLSR